jgi:hypothetical protein
MAELALGADCSLLVLADNTSTMNQMTIDRFPFISYAKSVVRGVIDGRTEYARIRTFPMLLGFTNDYGKPAVISKNILEAMNYLTICSIGSFDETVAEGLIEFNKFRHTCHKDTCEGFYTLPRFPEVFVVAIFSDLSTLPRGFHEFSIQREWLFRPDEHILLFCPAQTDDCDALRAHFADAASQLNLEVIPLTHAYHPNHSVRRLFPDHRIFHCIFEFARGDTAKGFLVPEQLTSFWPLPYDFSTRTDAGVANPILPCYSCRRVDGRIDLKTLRVDVYSFSTSERIDAGEYEVLSSREGAPIGVLVAEDGKPPRFDVLQWDFVDFLRAMAPIPSKADCDRYLASVPQPYIDSVVQFFNVNNYSFSMESLVVTSQKKFQVREQEREEMFKKHTEASTRQELIVPKTIDPVRCKPDLIAPLLDEFAAARTSFSMRTGRQQVAINFDTFNDRNFSSLDAVRSKTNYMKLFEKSPSAINEDVMQSFLMKQETRQEEEQSVGSQMEAIHESVRVDESENDRFSMIEELVLLLRDKDVKELEKRLHTLEAKPELFTIVKGLLKKAMERFRIEASLPRPFVVMLM